MDYTSVADYVTELESHHPRSQVPQNLLRSPANREHLSLSKNFSWCMSNSVMQ